MGNIRRYTWLITLGALFILLGARSLRDDLGPRRNIRNEAAPTLQAGAGSQPSINTPVVPARPIDEPLRPSPWSIAPGAGGGYGRLHAIVRTAGGVVAGNRKLWLRRGAEVFSLQTDGRGRFSFEATAEGPHEIDLGGLDHDGMPSHRTRWWAVPGELLGDVVLHAPVETTPSVPADARPDGGVAASPSRIPGRVVAADDGRPIGAFELVVRGLASGLETDVVVRRAVLGSRGLFDIVGLPPGEYMVQVYALGFAPMQVRATVPMPLVRAELTLRLPPGGELRGTVTRQSDGEPLVGALATLDAKYALGMLPTPVRLTATTDAEGNFTLPGIGAALGNLRVSAQGHIPQMRPQLRLSPGQPTLVSLSLRADDPSSL